MDRELLVIAEELEDRAAQLRELAGQASNVATPAPDVVTEGRELKAEDFFRDHGAFYDYLRGNRLLGPTISPDEFEGCETIILACAKDEWPISWLAYALATAYHETASTMQPIKEYGGTAYFTRMYDIRGARPAKARELGNLNPGDGAKYAGRGYPQTTGRTNYTRAQRELTARGWDVDLVNDPDQMMRPDVAAATMVLGMREGWFTTRRVSDDLPAAGVGTKSQFAATRDVINGRDKQDLIAGYAIDFQNALLQGGYDPQHA